MNRIARFLSNLLTSNSDNHYAHIARSLLERAANARGQSRYEAAQLANNAQYMLSILR